MAEYKVMLIKEEKGLFEWLKRSREGQAREAAKRHRENQGPVYASTQSPGVVYMSPALSQSPKYSNNCVLFLKNDLGVKLPSGLDSFADKKRSINLSGPLKVGDIAIIKVNFGPYAEYGHVAIVAALSAKSITITEAHWKGDIVDSRTSSGTTLLDAQQRLNIVSFYRP